MSKAALKNKATNTNTDDKNTFNTYGSLEQPCIQTYYFVSFAVNELISCVSWHLKEFMSLFLGN